MKPLEPPDSHHLEAACGWLGLGNWAEANEELERITAQQRAHPEVLTVRCTIYGMAQKWDYVVEVAGTLCRMRAESAFGPMNLAHALRQLNRTEEARNALLHVADRFPGQWRIPYQLACYCCQLGKKKDALRWLGRAIDAADQLDIRIQALDEPDLESLWVDIAEI